jgi:eukaryotic-like serine/threonine-protein kinase
VPPWGELFEAAGFDLASFHPATPLWNPPFAYDTRAAWQGTFPDRPDIPIRVEAAGWRGRPVWFQIVAPWTRPQRMDRFAYTPAQRAAGVVGALLGIAALCASLLLARRNLRLGRGDRRGAARIATFAILAGFTSWLLEADHVLDLDQELGLFFRGMGLVLVLAGFLWLLYLALEPAVRRVWPDTLISWTRLLSGRFRDPLVGAHALWGVAGGLLMACVALGAHALRRLAGVAGPGPGFMNLDALLGVSDTLRLLLDRLVASMFLSMAMLLLLVGLRALLRRQWLAALLGTLLLGLPDALSSGLPLGYAVGFSMLLIGVGVALLLRQGLLALAVALLVVGMLTSMPLTPDLGAWTAQPTRVVLVALFALSYLALRGARGEA